ncbi:MAG: UDP-2,3-diacylglucosamine diphosphatase [Candidatus Zixiibacteriota bacterium]|nr:MAG: UDP-2,3-diacylglucosamine diphosphatase [candidate division Zixibacteria bacterium]
MAVYFFSDVHLGAGEKELEKIKLEKLYSLFDLMRADADKVYILGDLFDFWFEYRHAIPKEHLQVVFRLAAMIKSGIEVHYISGNHDFWLGDFLANEVGIKIHRDFYETIEDGKRLFIIHGDGLSPADWKYRILKKILRNRVNIWLYQKIPCDIGIPLAKFVSSSSRLHTDGRPNRFVEDYEVYAGNKLKSGYDAVLIGHTHYPQRIEYDGGIYLNTGDMIRNFSYGRLDNGELTLEYL